MFTYECEKCGYISDFEQIDENLPHGCPKCRAEYGPLEMRDEICVDEEREMKITEKEIKIMIVSGEDDIGTVEVYNGKRTQRAIRARLTRERCNGDRWARAIQYSHTNAHGNVGVNLETGEYCPWPTSVR